MRTSARGSWGVCWGIVVGLVGGGGVNVCGSCCCLGTVDLTSSFLRLEFF